MEMLESRFFYRQIIPPEFQKISASIYLISKWTPETAHPHTNIKWVK